VSVTFALNALGDDITGVALMIAVVAVVALGAVFISRQRSSRMPIAEWKLFRNRSYAGATAYILLNNLVMYTTLLTIPFFVEEVQGGGSSTTGLLLGAMSVLMALLAPVAGRLSDGLGRRPPAFVGSVIVLAAMVIVLAGISEDSTTLFLGLSLAMLGVGMGISFGPASTAAIESAPRELAGAAAGTNSMMRYVGSIIGAGVLGAVLTDDGGSTEIGLFRVIFALLVVMAGIACVSTLFIHRYVAERDRDTVDSLAVERSPAR
jgi:MFS family permease